MVLIKIVAILLFVFGAAHAVNTGNWHPFMPNGYSGVLTGRRHRVLHLHRIRFGLDRGRRMRASAARHADRDLRDADHLRAAVWVGGAGAHRHRELDAR